MKKTLVFVVLFFILFPPLVGQAYSASSYVLPYPSVMPGGIAYKLHLLLEKVEKYWYFGDFGQFIYNLRESDKYLVEAKTLFDYQQYLLGEDALQKSDIYFQQTLPYLQVAKAQGKDIAEYQQILHLASEKHQEVLEKISQEVPSVVVWNPEKAASTSIHLHTDLLFALQLRKKYE